jgi:hypothetical protein
MIPPDLESMFEEVRNPVMFATVDDYPHATPMNWLWLKNEEVFWFNPAGGTKKIDNMKRNGNVCFGTVDGMRRFEYGFWALGRNAFIKKRMLVKKSQIGFDPRILKFWITYARHPDIHYSTLPWVAAFVRVKPKRILYWLDDQIEKEIRIS